MTGLTEEQVLKNRKLYGSNKLPDPPMKKWYDFAKDALSEKITMILITIAVLQLVLGFLGVMELSEPLMILMVLAIDLNCDMVFFDQTQPSVHMECFLL